MNERTRRNFDGTSPTGKKISDLLPQILVDIGSKTGEPQEAVFLMWFSLIGEKMAPFTQPLSLKNGMLTIKVKSATLYALLCQHEKPRLLKALQAKFSVKDIVFRIG
jgi:hypothetical protein